MKKVPVETILNWMDKHNMSPEYHHGIAEQGYDDIPLITADWWQRKNGDLHTRLMDYILEAYENKIDCAFYDEWTTCSECYKAVRTTPDSHGWTPSFLWTSDYSIACHECIESDEGLQEDVIEYYKNNTNHAVLEWFYNYLESHGFICYSPDEYCKRFETGFHPGQNDDPAKVAKDIEENLPNYDYIFKIDSVGQFDCYWSVYLRKQA